MHRTETSPRITYRVMEVLEVRQDTCALPSAAQSLHEIARTQEPGNLMNSSNGRSRSSQGAPSSSTVGQYAAEDQPLRNELDGMQQVQAELQGRAGVEVYDFLRQEDRIRRTTAETELLMSDDRAHVGAVIHALRREELQVVTRLRGETSGNSNHESAAYLDKLQVAANDVDQIWGSAEILTAWVELYQLLDPRSARPNPDGSSRRLVSGP